MIGFGNALLWIALAASLFSAAAYLLLHRGRAQAELPGRRAFWVAGLALAAASVVLLYAFIWCRYEISYVANYSSRDLPLIYRFSAFWAGQEGSLLFWALMGAVMGLVVASKAGRWTGSVMFPFALTQGFLLLLLVIKSPFQPVPMPLADGHGLNPLLQDPWMAIHPPAMFLGYAAAAVPYSFAIAALLRRDHEDGWIARALPWTLFAWVALGAGIFIGGYWAYRVLGWGGYWAWDPVENASLVPWLVATALLHGMIVQQRRGTLRRTTLFLGIILFSTVIYCTYLTRSGVLERFSVHSFGAPGMTLYSALLGGTILSVALPGALLLFRAKRIRTHGVAENVLSREFFFFLGILVLLLSAAIVTVGTSTPIFSSLWGEATSVQPEFYNRTHMPVGILLALLVGAAPFLAWQRNAPGSIGRRLRWHAAITLAGAWIAFLVGVRDGWLLLLVTVSIFAVSTNAALLLRSGRRVPLNTGGYLAHVGLGLMLIGIVGSSAYSRSEKLTLQPGQTGEALGYRLTYIGSEQLGQNGLRMRLLVANGAAVDTAHSATPRMVFSPQMNSWVHHPAVLRSLHKDLYISPLGLEGRTNNHGINHFELQRGESAEAGGYTFTFERFDMGGEHGMDADAATVGAVLEVTRPDGTAVTVTATTTSSAGRGIEPKVVAVPETPVELAMVAIQVPWIQIAVAGLPQQHDHAAPVESASVEVSIKPLINLVWLGTVLLMLGGLIAAGRRALEIGRGPRARTAPAAAVPGGNGRGSNGRNGGASGNGAGSPAPAARRRRKQPAGSAKG